MLSRSVIQDVLYAALATGGDFAEIFVEDKLVNNLSLVGGLIEAAVSGRDYGVGIRIFHGTNYVYAYTNDDSRENLLRVAKTAAEAISAKRCETTISLCQKEFTTLHPIVKYPGAIKKSDKVDLMQRAYHAAKSYDPIIEQIRVGYLDEDQHVMIANSEGLLVEDRRVRTRTNISAVAAKGSEKQEGFYGPGASMGFEFYDTIKIEDYAKEAARIAKTMIYADLCPSGVMPVVIDNEFGGVIFHEACGHSLEATSVAKKNSEFTGMLGQRVAPEIVTAIDDGTIPNAWGSMNIDDEGTPMQRKVLIDKGILTSYMIDKFNGRRMNMPSTGSGRRQSYKFAPTSRMSNTFIAAGDSSPEQIIANTEYGLFARYMGGGSVNPATGDFNFAVREGYIIRNGKIAEPVRGASLIGRGSQVLQKIDMVGNNLAHGQGMCGSMSGSVPTNVGQPMLRVAELIVGGQKGEK